MKEDLLREYEYFYPIQKKKPVKGILELKKPNNTPSFEDLERSRLKFLKSHELRQYNAKHSAGKLKVRGVYKPHYYKIETLKFKANLCAFCKICFLPPTKTETPMRARNCSRCVYCKTCVEYYCSSIGVPAETGYFNPKHPEHKSYNFDCTSRVGGYNAKEGVPQCAVRSS